jgi:hypothetical protein
MPFDATPLSERPRRLLALDGSLLAFGEMPQGPDGDRVKTYTGLAFGSRP